MIITDAGLDALVDAQNGGSDEIEITEVGLTSTIFVAAPTLTALPGQFKLLDAVSGLSVSETVIHLTAYDTSADIYDVTGFGLLGHLGNICKASGVQAQLNSQMIPVIAPEVLEWIDAGCIPGGTKANLELAKEFTKFAPDVPEAFQSLLADAQTSGGLLLCVPPAHLEHVLSILGEENALSSSIIGELHPAADDSQRITVN